METRRFGRIGHMSSVAIFGAVAFLKLTQEESDQAMVKVIEAGVNHIDVAPEYGLAEARRPGRVPEDGAEIVGDADEGAAHSLGSNPEFTHRKRGAKCPLSGTQQHYH